MSAEPGLYADSLNILHIYNSDYFAVTSKTSIHHCLLLSLYPCYMMVDVSYGILSATSVSTSSKSACLKLLACNHCASIQDGQRCWQGSCLQGLLARPMMLAIAGLLDFLFGAELVGMPTLLLAAVDSARVQSCIAPGHKRTYVTLPRVKQRPERICSSSNDLMDTRGHEAK